MRTNIVIEDDLMQEALQISGLKSKKAIVHEALLLLIRLKQQQKIRELRGKVKWDGNLNELRTDWVERILHCKAPEILGY